MNDDLQKQLVALIDAAHKTGTDVYTFMAQQAPRKGGRK